MSSNRPLSAWQAALEQADHCPYVGPRPQTASDQRGMLIGRGPDLQRITRAVLDRPLVVLHGYSGCGKSSLLQNGLYHSLTEQGYTVLVARQWGGLPGPFAGSSEDVENQVERYLARAVKLTHEDPRALIAVPDDIDLESIVDRGQLGRILDEEFRESGVLVLDQFEELLRQDSGNTANAVMRWIIKSGYRRDTHFLISLRTDSLHLLDPLLRGVKPYSMDRVSVSELTDPEAIEKVIRTTEPGSDSRITDEAVIELMGLWKGREPRPRLLDLQATLYALYFRSKAKSSWEAAGGIVTIDDSAVHDLEKADPGQDPFKFGLRDAIRLKMNHAEDACRHQGLDEYLVCGAREIVRAAAPFLSSRDFKVPVDEIELARKALSRELRVLERVLADELDPGSSRNSKRSKRLIDDTLTEMFGALRQANDFLSVRLPRLTSLENSPAAHAAAAVPDRGRVSRRVVVTAGPMMGSTAAATLFEEIRRAVFAIEWLLACEIVRRDPDGTLLLVHDGSGSALAAWAEADETGPRSALRQLTGAVGEHYMWEGAEIRSTDDEYRVVANLNWRDCRIFGARFQKVVFVNCDFRRSQFESCSFHGTTFVNCLLDDARFEDCKILGPVNLETQAEGTLKATFVGPSFTVGTTPSEVGFFAPYPPYPQVTDGEGAQFFSDTSGIAAQPGGQPSTNRGELICHFVTGPESATARPDSGERPVPRRAPASGGVAMVGGRLCMLTIHGCESVEGGSFAFHYVSGSGLDIVEQGGGSVEIYDAAIRGISVSRDPNRTAGADRPSQTDPFALDVKHSFLANVYFADGLVGSATFQDSRVLMLINASDNAKNQGLRVQIKNCRYQFLVNTDEPDHKSVEDSRQEATDRYFDPVEGTDSRFDVLNRRRLAESLERMDYRSHPEEWEEEQRERWARARVSVQARGRGRRPGGPRVWNR